MRSFFHAHSVYCILHCKFTLYCRVITLMPLLAEDKTGYIFDRLE